jgi:hypothetical protein
MYSLATKVNVKLVSMYNVVKTNMAVVNFLPK